MQDYLGEVDVLQGGRDDAAKVNLVHDDGREVEAFEGAGNHCPQVHPVQDQLSKVKLVK